MGMYDTVKGVPSDYDDQVKLWENTCAIFEVGDTVSGMNFELRSYSVRLNTHDETLPPGYIIVEHGKITNAFSEEPLPHRVVFDKWGRPTSGYEAPISPLVTALAEAFPPELQDALLLVRDSFQRRHKRSERNQERELETVAGKWYRQFENLPERHLKYAALICEFLGESLSYDRHAGLNLPEDETVKYTIDRLVEALKGMSFEKLEAHINRLRQIEDVYKRDLWTANRIFVCELLQGAND